MTNHFTQNVYHGSGFLVMSIDIILPTGQRGSIGYLPYLEQYAFGVASRKETIKITSGIAVINGVNSDEAPDKTVVIVPGEEILITAHTPVTYLCIYG